MHIGNIFVDKFVEDDDQFEWGMIVDVLTNRSFSEFPGDPFFKYYNPKKYSRRKPTSKEKRVLRVHGLQGVLTGEP